MEESRQDRQVDHPSDQGSPAIFISVAESQKDTLGRPLQALLAASGLRGHIVSDAPLLDRGWSPEEKVDGYLDRSDAVIVLATADLESDDGHFTRPNIGDEIARARSKPRLRDRVLVLKEPGVSLPSNINPAYEHLDPEQPEVAFDRALAQLRAWGFPMTGGSSEASSSIEVTRSGGQPRQGVPDHQPLVRRAVEALAGLHKAARESSLAVGIAGGPQQDVLRPAELEDPALARELQRELLFGSSALFDPAEGTRAEMSGNTLVIGQARSSMTLDAEGTLVVLRPVHRLTDRPFGMGALIEEDLRDDIEIVLRFGHLVLDRIDPRGLITHVAPVAALLGLGYGAWRTRAERAASPNSMTINMTTGKEVAAELAPPPRPRRDLQEGAAAMAADLTILLRRKALR